MNGFNLLYDSSGAAGIETQITRLGIALGIDWDDEAQVQALAKEALHHSQEALVQYSQNHSDYKQKAKIELFGLAALMMEIMKDSAEEGIHTHGGTAWKSFSRALMREMDN
ncbi:MAG: hypothetical protein WDM70_11340 [Nitrosomonadales bacterium]